MARSSDDDGDGRGRDDAGDGRDGQDDDGRDGRGGGGGNRATELLRAIPRRRNQFQPPLRGSGVGGRERRRGGPGYECIQCPDSHYRYTFYKFASLHSLTMEDMDDLSDGDEEWTGSSGAGRSRGGRRSRAAPPRDEFIFHILQGDTSGS